MIGTVAGLAVLALATGCTRENPPPGGGQPDPTARPTISVPQGSPSPLPVAATATPANGEQLQAEINDIRADGEGLAVLRFTVTNTGSQPFDMDRSLADRNRDPAVGYDFFSCELAVSAVTLSAGEERYHPLYRSDGNRRYCMNARWGGQTAGGVVEPGQSRILFATYILPDDVRTATVEIPGFEPVEDLPVTR